MENKTIIKIIEFLEKEENRKKPFTYKLTFNEPITEEELNVKGNLDLSYSKITSLPDGLKVGGYLNLRFLDIEILPEGLKVGGDLSLRGCKHLRSLPKGLIVKGYLFLNNSSLKKYTDEQLREMIEPDGFINGKIIR